MIKYFCDLCNKEVKNKETVGYAWKLFPWNNVTMLLTERSTIIKEYYICEKCKIKIQRFIDSLKNQ